MSKYFYERNSFILEHEINILFEEILWMPENEFREWFAEMRKTIVYAWDELGIPPRVGYDEDAIINQFNKMIGFNTKKFEVVNELDGESCIRNTSVIGNAANQFFPTMMKTRINYKQGDQGLSIYDHFVRDDLFEKVIKYGKRHFKRDSFYAYSLPVRINDEKNFLINAETGVEWIEKFENNFRQYGTHDYWLSPKVLDEDGEQEYTGYRTDKDDTSYDLVDDEYKKVDVGIQNQKFLFLTRKEVDSLTIPEKCMTNVNWDKTDTCWIRLYKYGQKLFPLGLKAFRISWCQYAVNFPPLTAKYLYEKYTEHCKDQDIINIYDPSSGWGGRILGCMSVDDRKLHYIGTDPNTDHTIANLIADENSNYTKYEYLAEFFNNKTYRSYGLFPSHNTYDVYQLGSEVIRNNEKFQKYKGQLDLVFTSPPYFAKEAYSEDSTQSYKKFDEYDTWREGFLRPTLETCVEYLKPDRYLIWNIADAKFGNDMLPLEKDSCDILKELGMKYVRTEKMILAQMPGGNRIDPKTGKPKAKNFCKVNNTWFKYEPIFIFYKEKS